MNRKHWITGLALGAAIAFLVAAAMTYADWKLNPAGIFHGPGGTNWGFVRDTLISWFLPVFPVAAAFALLIVRYTSRCG